MFEESTRWLVREIDRNGSLIGSRLNDSEKLKSLAVVIKRSPSHFWQKIRYRPTDFTLNDLLQGEPIQIDKGTKTLSKLTSPDTVKCRDPLFDCLVIRINWKVFLALTGDR